MQRDRDYYTKFLRNAGQMPDQQADPNEVLEIKITFPNDVKTFRRWVYVWFFIQICACITFLMTIPGIIVLHPVSILIATPSAACISVSYILQRYHRELYNKLYKRFVGKPNDV